MKSVVLFLIAAALIVAAVVVNSNLDRRERLDSDINHSVGDLRGSLTGRYEYKETKAQDRLPVYALGGIGAMFVLAGIVTLGGSRRKEA